MSECLSCKDERSNKKLPPMQKIELPGEVTSQGFRHPKLPTIACPYCDGETLVTSALRAHKERQAE